MGAGKLMKNSAIFVTLCFILSRGCASKFEIKQEAIPRPGARGDVIINGLNYYFSEAGEDQSWEGAISACEALGMRLVSLDNSATDNSILGYIEQNLGDNNQWWSAGMRPADSEEWTWVPKGEPFRYLHWVDGYPGTNYAISGCVRTIFVTSPYSRGWAEVECSAVSPYICEEMPPEV